MRGASKRDNRLQENVSWHYLLVRTMVIPKACREKSVRDPPQALVREMASSHARVIAGMKAPAKRDASPMKKIRSGRCWCAQRSEAPHRTFADVQSELYSCLVDGIGDAQPLVNELLSHPELQSSTVRDAASAEANQGTWVLKAYRSRYASSFPFYLFFIFWEHIALQN